MTNENLVIENKRLKEELISTKVLNKIQKEMLENFQLHDDAGTAYIYLGPPNEELENLIKTENVKELNNKNKYFYIVELLYEIEILMETTENEKVIKNLEELKDIFSNLIEETK